jgi:hypothetical protein
MLEPLPDPAENHRLSVPPRLSELEALGERIARLAAQISAATYQLLVLLHQFDERTGWNCGFRSCAHWLNWRTGLDLGAAREKVRVARALASLPLLSAAMARGEVSFSKVRALTRVATPANEGELLAFARAGTAAHVEKVVRAWRRVDRLAEQEQDRRRHQSRRLRVYTDEEGMVVVQARLTPEAGEALLKALDAADGKLHESRRGADDAAVERESEGVDQRWADALGLVAESALAAGLDPGTRGDRYQVVVHADAAALSAGSDTGASALAGGTHVSAETSRRLACDAALVVMRHDAEGALLDIGRRTRTIPPALRRALEHRDRGCRFPGCGLRLCDGHHVRHWADGGETKLHNLVLLCRRHHRAVHEEGYRVELLPAGEARFYRPDGRPLPQAPPPPLRLSNGKATLDSILAALDVSLSSDFGMPTWDGSRMDLRDAIEGLWPIGRGQRTARIAAERGFGERPR